MNFIKENFYLLPEYSEYIRDDEINRQAVENFTGTCSEIIRENKKFFRKIFIPSTLYKGSSSALMEYTSLLALGYLKIKKNMITTAQFLAYYRATDFLVSGMDFLITSINKLHLNYLFIKNERMQVKEEINEIADDFETLELQDVCFAIGERCILSNVFLKVEKGDKVAVIGKVVFSTHDTSDLGRCTRVYEMKDHRCCLGGK